MSKRHSNYTSVVVPEILVQSLFVDILTQMVFVKLDINRGYLTSAKDHLKLCIKRLTDLRSLVLPDNDSKD